MRWLGPFKSLFITEVGTTKLTTLVGYPMNGFIFGSHMNPTMSHRGNNTCKLKLRQTKMNQYLFYFSFAVQFESGY